MRRRTQVARKSLTNPKVARYAGIFHTHPGARAWRNRDSAGYPETSLDTSSASLADTRFSGRAS
jgi:hypothetical protein